MQIGGLVLKLKNSGNSNENMDERNNYSEEQIETDFTIEQAVKILNKLQKQGLLKITGVSPLQISLRKKLEDCVEVKLNFIEEYSKLWLGKKSIDGYYLSQPKSENLSRMIKFVKENPEFSPETILKATNRYISEKSITGFKFAKKSHKFIYDLEGSTLFSYCHAVSQNETEIKEKVEGI